MTEDFRGTGKSVHYLVRMAEERMMFASMVLDGARRALLHAAYGSKNVYVMGHARYPTFAPLANDHGFRGTLCVADEQLCMDAIDFGRCNRWCPRTTCRRKHPMASHLTEVIVEVQAHTLEPATPCDAFDVQAQEVIGIRLLQNLGIDLPDCTGKP